MNHHPQWSNIYKTVVIDLITHSEGSVTQLDVELKKTLLKNNNNISFGGVRCYDYLTIKTAGCRLLKFIGCTFWLNKRFKGVLQL